MYRKVLLAYDGSQSGRTALLECADINNFLHAEIHLLAVAPLMAETIARIASGESVMSLFADQDGLF